MTAEPTGMSEKQEGREECWHPAGSLAMYVGGRFMTSYSFYFWICVSA